MALKVPHPFPAALNHAAHLPRAQHLSHPPHPAASPESPVLILTHLRHRQKKASQRVIRTRYHHRADCPGTGDLTDKPGNIYRVTTGSNRTNSTANPSSASEPVPQTPQPTPTPSVDITSVITLGHAYAAERNMTMNPDAPSCLGPIETSECSAESAINMPYTQFDVIYKACWRYPNTNPAWWSPATISSHLASSSTSTSDKESGSPAACNSGGIFAFL